MTLVVEPADRFSTKGSAYLLLISHSKGTSLYLRYPEELVEYIVNLIIILFFNAFKSFCRNCVMLVINLTEAYT